MTSHDFDVGGFLRDGFLRLDGAFSPDIAEQARASIGVGLRDA